MLWQTVKIRGHKQGLMFIGLGQSKSSHKEVQEDENTPEASMTGPQI